MTGAEEKLRDALAEERDTLKKENEQLNLRVKGALELAADLVAQRDEFKQMKATHDGLIAELDRKSKDLRSWEKDCHAAQTHAAQLKAANNNLQSHLEDTKRMLTIAQGRYAPMVKENEHHRRERDVLETQLLLLRDKALDLSRRLPSISNKGPEEEAALRSDLERELYAMATPRKS